MTEWIVIDHFGNMIAQGFWTKGSSRTVFKKYSNTSVIQKNQPLLTTDSYEFVAFLKYDKGG